MPQDKDSLLGLLGLLGLGPGAAAPAIGGLTADKYVDTFQAALERGGGPTESLKKVFPMASGLWMDRAQAATQRGVAQRDPKSLPTLQSARKQPERPSRATVNIPPPAAPIPDVPLSVALAEEFPSRPPVDDVETAELLQALRSEPFFPASRPWLPPRDARADLPPGYAGWPPVLPQRSVGWHLARQQAPMPAPRRSQEEQAIAYEALLQDLAPLYAQAQTQELEAETAIQSAAENELLLQRLEGLR